MTPEQTLDWLAEQHKSQCNEDRPVQEWIRSMKLMLPAPVQEPYGYVSTHTNGLMHFNKTFHGVYTDTATEIVAVYTTPPAAQRQWVGLTDEETDTEATQHEQSHGFIQGVQWANAKLKKENT